MRESDSGRSHSTIAILKLSYPLIPFTLCHVQRHVLYVPQKALASDGQDETASSRQELDTDPQSH